MKNSLVSFIIPCFNYGRFLQDSINSVLAQAYIHWECLVIDDGSTDDTREIAGKFVASDNRIKYHYKQNGGLSSARNYGIDKAQGDFLCFLDADDLADEQKLKEQIDCFLKNPVADIVYGKAMFFEKNDKRKLYNNKHKSAGSELKDISGKGHTLIAALNKNNIMVVSAPLIRKKVFERVGNFDEHYRAYEDWHFWMRCALANCSFFYCDKPAVCTYIRFGHESMMSDQKKLVKAGIQLRRFLSNQLPFKFKFYNYYRLLRLRIKLLLN